MSKKIISLLLVLVLLLAPMMGCSKQDADSSDTQSGSTSGSSGSSDASAAEKSGDSLVTEPGVLPIVTKPVTLTIGLVESSNVTDYETNYYTKYLEEKTGIDLDFYFFPSSETSQKLELMVTANEELPDIIMYVDLSDAAKASYGKQGVFIPLNEYMDKYAYFWKQTYDKYCSDTEKKVIETLSKSPDGNIYGFPFMDVDPTDSQVESIYINHVWLEKLGLKVPTTTDELYEVLAAFRDKDPNGNGKKDELPLVGYNTIDVRGDLIFILMNSFIYYNYSNYGRFNVENGKLSVPYITEDYREGLRYIHKLYKEGLIAPISFTQDYKQLKALADRPKNEDTIVGALAHHPWSGSQGWTYNDENYGKLVEYTAIGPLKGPKGVAWSPYKLVGIDFTTYITKDCEYPEVAFRLLDFMADETTSLISRRGEPGVDWEYVEGDVEAHYSKLGFKGVYRVLNDIWAEPEQNKNWHAQLQFLPASLFAGFAKRDFANELEKKRDALFLNGFYRRYGQYPDEIVTNLVYTDEELNEISEISTTITNYENEARVLFVTGEMDIEKDWDSYVQQIKDLGLDKWLSVAQQAYTRMNSK